MGSSPVTPTSTNRVNTLFQGFLRQRMLFLSDSEEGYTEASKSDWNCFSTAHGLNVDELIEMIEVK